MPLYPCKQQRCGALVSEPGYCDKHRPAAETRRKEAVNRKQTDRFYSSALWQKIRKRKKSTDPLCQDCLAVGTTKPADMVDHITPIKVGGSGVDPDNLKSLCWSCHAKKTARDRKTYGY